MSLEPIPSQKSNAGFSTPWIVSLVTIVLMTLSAPWIATAAMRVLAVDSTTPLEWVPPSFPQRLDYERFSRDFESGDVIIATWPECVIDNPKIDQCAFALQSATTARTADGKPWFSSVATGSIALQRLTEPPLSLDRTVAIDRLTGVIIGPDKKTTCLIVGFTAAGLGDRMKAVSFVRSALIDIAGAPTKTLQMAGPVIDNVSVDLASTESLNTFALPAGAVILLLSWWSLRSLFHATMIFLVSLYCVGVSFALLYVCGDRMNPVLIVLPLLVLMLGVSGGIHLVNYLVDAYDPLRPAGTVRRAMVLGWLPCSLSAGTTAIGLASLVISELEPIRVFGFHAAAGVLAELVLLFLVIPGLFERWPIHAVIAQQKSLGSSLFAALVIRHNKLIVIASFFLMAITGLGVGGIRTSVRIDTLFSTNSPIMRAYRTLEETVAPLVPIEIIVRFSRDSDLRPIQRVDLIRAIETRLIASDAVSGVVSATTFLPDLPQSNGTRTTALKAIMARKLEQSMLGLTDIKYVREYDDAQLWRITARISALRDVDYGFFLDSVRTCVEPILTEYGGSSRGISAEFTGVMPLIHEIQRSLLRDLFSSFLSACLVILVVMMIVERGIITGLIAMIPNIFPMVLLFGILGWTQRPLDIGSVMTASIALGMAIDGTLHFLTFFRRTITAGKTAQEAILKAYGHCAAAMTQSAIVCGCGILVFSGSSFAPTSRFAWMLALLIAAALAGDLVILPAMLTGRLGRFFGVTSS